MQFLYAYLILINASAFTLMLSDKYKAKKKLYRIPEAALMWSAALGGSIGALCGMYLVRHKTRHPKFTVGIPIILILQVLFAAVVWATIR